MRQFYVVVHEYIYWVRVNNFLRKKEADSGDVHIRVVFSGDKHVEVKNGMLKRYVFIDILYIIYSMLLI